MSEKKLVVAVVGATGAVGREMLKTLESRNFPATEVVPFASARSAGTKVPYGDSELVVRELKEDVFEGIDIAIFSAGGSTSEKYAPHAAAAGCTVEAPLEEAKRRILDAVAQVAPDFSRT